MIATSLSCEPAAFLRKIISWTHSTQSALLLLLLPSRSCLCFHPRDKSDMTNILEARWSQVGWGTAKWESVTKSCTGTDGILRISTYVKLKGNLSSLHWKNHQLKCVWQIYSLITKRENPIFSTGLQLKSYDVYIKLCIFIQNYDYSHIVHWTYQIMLWHRFYRGHEGPIMLVPV